MNNVVLFTSGGYSPINSIIFTSECFTRENYWRITSWVETRYSRQPMYFFNSYRLFWLLNLRQTDANPHGSIAAPLLSQLVVILWRRTNTYCDVILSDFHQNVSNRVTCVFPPSLNWLSIVNYRVRFTAFSREPCKNTMFMMHMRNWKQDMPSKMVTTALAGGVKPLGAWLSAGTVMPNWGSL